MSAENTQLKIKLVRSLVGYPQTQRRVAWGLGLRKPNSVVLRPNTPDIMGMVRKIPHLVQVEVVENK
jgi:large subunit ribosomal protein L30